MLLHRSLLIAAFAFAPLSAAHAAGWTETVVHSFNGTGGSAPTPELTADEQGNLYGVTVDGGIDTYGVVYKLVPPAVGQTKWTETTLFDFPGTGSHGANPSGGLVLDSNGNLYGTTSMGGLGSDGVIFELKPPALGQTKWTELPLYNFPRGGADGAEPSGRMVMDSFGNFYGMAGDVVFELTPPAAGKTKWTETVVQSFSSGLQGPVLDQSGNLYVTTTGTNAEVIELSPPPVGQTAWSETVLYTFTDVARGSNPIAGVVLDTEGNLYGVTLLGGAASTGTIFRLSPPTAGHTKWTETVLHSFNGTSGSTPSGGLILDANGNLYGNTSAGGASGDGVAYELKVPAEGQTKWTYVVLRSYKGAAGDVPRGAFTLSNGSLLGVTRTGGATGDGDVIALSPPG